MFVTIGKNSKLFDLLYQLIYIIYVSIHTSNYWFSNRENTTKEIDNFELLPIRISRGYRIYLECDASIAGKVLY